MLNKSSSKLLKGTEKLLLTFVFFVGAAVASFTIWQNISYYTDSYSPLECRTLFFSIIMLLVSMAAIYHLPIGHKKLLTIMIFLSLSFRIILTFSFNPPAVSDFSIMYEAAIKASAGDFSWMETKYFQLWGYQIPFVLIQSLLLKIYPSITTLKIANVFFMLCSNILIYCILKHLVSVKAGLVGFALYMIYPQPMLLGPVLTNQHGAMAFFLLAVYLLLRGRNWKWPVFAALAAVIGNLFRSDTAVILLAAGATAVFTAVRLCLRPGKQEKLLIRNITLFILIYMTLNYGISKAADASGFCKGGFKNNCPQWKIVTGLNPNSSGQYSEENIDILDMENSSKTWGKTFEIAAGYLEDADLWKFFNEKMEIMWAYKETSLWTSGYLDKDSDFSGKITVGEFMNDITNYDKAVYLLIWILYLLCAIIKVYSSIRSPMKIKPGTLLINFIILANYAAYILIEVQMRYRYFMMPFLVIMAGAAVDALLNNEKPTAHMPRAFHKTV